jgi:hypothetical protein
MDAGKEREHDCMDAGGTPPRTMDTKSKCRGCKDAEERLEVVEPCRERRPRVMPGAITVASS